MAQTETIREFLVRLGFVKDEPALTKFTDGIGKATKSVLALSAAVSATATTVAVGVQKFAANLENLYFSATRVGSSVTNLQAFDRAAQNFGATAAEAQSAVEGLAQALRVNPALHGLIGGLLGREGLKESADQVQNLVNLGRVLSRMPIFQAERYAQMLGINERTLLAIMNPSFQAEFTKRQKELGPSFEKAAADAHRFEEQVRDLGTVLAGFGAQVFDAIENKLGGSIGTLTEWLQKNGPTLAERIANALKDFLDWLNRVVPKIEALADKFIELDDKSGGWLTKLTLIAVALKTLGGTEIISGIFGLTSAMLKLGGAMLGIPGVAAAGGLSLGGAAALAVGTGAAVAGTAYGVDKLLYNRRIQGAATRLHQLAPGLTQASISGIVANLYRESFLEPFASGDNGQAVGIAQWHKPYQEEFQRKFGGSLRNASLDQQLQFLVQSLQQNPGIWNQLTMGGLTAGQASNLFTRSYERPADLAGESAKRSALAEQISNQITINIDGAQSPQATGRAVEDAMQRVFGNMTRDALATMK